jgi:phosphoribosylanthranilate isomerase
MAQLEALGVQYGGMILYEKSPRFAGGKIDASKIKQLNKIKKVGVFVHADAKYILAQQENYGLDMVQLHGDETPDFCAMLRKHLPVIKAFRIRNEKDLKHTEQYAASCDYFLFDAAGELYGGNGKLFDWKLLESYTGNVPFFISGGIGLSEAEQVRQFPHPALYAVDVNSRFEISPGEKNMDELKKFLCHLNSD